MAFVAAIVPDLLAFLDQEPRNFQRELIETLEKSLDLDATEDSDTSGDAQDVTLTSQPAIRDSAGAL